MGREDRWKELYVGKRQINKWIAMEIILKPGKTKRSLPFFSEVCVLVCVLARTHV